MNLLRSPSSLSEFDWHWRCVVRLQLKLLRHLLLDCGDSQPVLERPGLVASRNLRGRLAPSSRTTFAVDACGPFFNAVRDASNWSSIVQSVSACLVPIPSSSLTDLACPATNTPLSSPRYGIVSFSMRSVVEMSSTPLPAFS